MSEPVSGMRYGQVSSVNPANNTVRVAYDDEKDPSGNGFVSAEMQVLQRNTVGARHLSLPKVGEHVLCSHMGNGGEEGFVLGSYYTGSNMPDVDGEGVERTEYDDGTIIEYNTNTGTATVKAAGDVIVEAAGKLSIKAAGEITIHSDTAVTITAPVVNIN